MRDIFDDVAEADVVIRNNPVQPGIYELDVKNFDFGDKRKGKQMTAEFVIASAKPIDPASPPNAVGTTVSSLACFYGKGLDSAPSNMKKAVCAALGEDPAQVSKADFRATLGELFSAEGMKAQLLRGRRVLAETNVRVYADGARHFLNLRAASDSVNTPELVAKRRAAIEAAGTQLADIEGD